MQCSLLVIYDMQQHQQFRLITYNSPQFSIICTYLIRASVRKGNKIKCGGANIFHIAFNFKKVERAVTTRVMQLALCNHDFNPILYSSSSCIYMYAAAAVL